MATDYWRVKELFASALDLAPAAREAYLFEASSGDARVLTEVRSLLAIHEREVLAVTRDAAAKPTRFNANLRDPPGTVIGPYTLLEVIGEGGMGIVYKAQQDAPIRRIVALKLIKLGMDTARVTERFENERQTLAMLNHPNVAAVFDAGATASGRPYFVMEYLPGKPITTFCDEHRYTTRQRLHLMLQACDAVQYAHQKAVIHRDLKPGNILVMLHENGTPIVKVIDFGIARATQQSAAEESHFTQSGELVGTPEYMSPEQMTLQPADVDIRSDVYSLGVVLYELLAGAPPFEPSTIRRAALAEVQKLIRERDPPRPSTRLSLLEADAAAAVAQRRGLAAAPTLARELSRELEWLPMKAMRKEPVERYQTAAELAADVRNYLADRPLIAGPESKAYQLRKLFRRNRGPAIASAAVLLSLVGGVLFTSIALVRESRQRSIAERERAEAHRQRALADANADAASNQEAIARATNDFLTRMLTAADPKKLLGERVTVRQALDSAVKDLDAGTLADRPLVEAAVRDTIGRTLRSLGAFKDAEPNLRRALDLRRAGLPTDDPLIVESLGNLGLLLQDLGDFHSAERHLAEALAVAQSNLQTPRPLLAVALNNLALLLDNQKRYGEAETLYRQSLALRRALHGDKDPRIATVLNNLAATLAAQDKLDEAEQDYREALAIRRAALPPTHPQLAMQMNNLAMLLRRQGKLDEARALAQQNVDISRAALPANHPDTAKALANLARILIDQQQWTQADDLLHEALAMCEASLPPNHPQTATTRWLQEELAKRRDTTTAPATHPGNAR